MQCSVGALCHIHCSGPKIPVIIDLISVHMYLSLMRNCMLTISDLVWFVKDQERTAAVYMHVFCLLVVIPVDGPLVLGRSPYHSCFRQIAQGPNAGR